jgi:hypothetical protein
MTPNPAPHDPRDEGGDPACWAHLFDDPPDAPDDAPVVGDDAAPTVRPPEPEG